MTQEVQLVDLYNPTTLELREAKQKAREEQEKLEKKKKYQAFLESIGLNDTNKNDFTFIDTPEWRKFYKFVGIYKK